MATESMLKTLRRHTISSSVYTSIKQAIISGELPPGSRVTEKMLEQAFDVSRSPVREAIVRLAQEGYLIGKAYKGYRVNHLTPREVREIYAVIGALEGLAFSLAIEQADDGQLSELLVLVDEMERGLAEGDVNAYGLAALNIRLRAAVFSKNDILANLHDQLFNHPAYIKPWATDDLEAVKRRAPDFPSLRQAILSRDAITAARVMDENLRQSLREVLAQLNKHDTPPGEGSENREGRSGLEP